MALLNYPMELQKVSRSFKRAFSSVALLNYLMLPLRVSQSIRELWLCGLTKLSDACTESLAKFQGSSLGLTGLTELSDAAAESLAKLKGSSVWLSGLTELSDAAAESLAKFQGLTSIYLVSLNYPMMPPKGYQSMRANVFTCVDSNGYQKSLVNFYQILGEKFQIKNLRNGSKILPFEITYFSHIPT